MKTFTFKNICRVHVPVFRSGLGCFGGSCSYHILPAGVTISLVNDLHHGGEGRGGGGGCQIQYAN